MTMWRRHLPGAEPSTGLRAAINELLRAGLSATSRGTTDPGEQYELATFDPGRAFIADHRAMRDLLDPLA